MMTNDKLAELQKAGQESVEAAKAIVSEHGEDVSTWPPTVRERYDGFTKAAGDKLQAIREAKDDLAIIEKARELGAAIGGTIGESSGSPNDGGHLALTGVHAEALGGRLIGALPKGPDGVKSLAAGQQTTSTIVLPEVVPTGRPAQSILDLLPSRVVAPSYSFLRQSARTFPTSGPTPEGGVKPTAVVSVQAIENRLRVVAFISEQISHYLLTDAVNLERFVVDELIFGVRQSLEREVLTGDGTGEHLTGILATSGINAPAFATDILTSVRGALTVLFAGGYEPAVIALSASDWQKIELQAATTNAVAYQGVPVDSTARKLWGVPVVLSQGLGAKTGLVLGDGAVTLDHDGRIDTAWSDSVSDDFTRNFVRCRVEGRFGVSVNQPAAVVRVATAA